MDYNYIENLAAKSKANDERAKERLAEQFKPFIINISKRTFIHGYNNEDIQLECYKTLFNCVAEYESASHRFVAYAVNGIKKSINALIKRNLTRISTDGCESLILNSDALDPSAIADNINIEEDICQKSANEYLKQILSSLKEDEKELIYLLFFKNTSVKDYASLKHISYSNAINRKNTILDKLSVILESKGLGGGISGC